jgi:hypothetical protein
MSSEGTGRLLRNAGDTWRLAADLWTCTYRGLDRCSLPIYNLRAGFSQQGTAMVGWGTQRAGGSRRGRINSISAQWRAGGANGELDHQRGNEVSAGYFCFRRAPAGKFSNRGPSAGRLQPKMRCLKNVFEGYG